MCAKWLQYFLERNSSLCCIKDKHICNAQRHKETTIRKSENTTFELYFVSKCDFESQCVFHCNVVVETKHNSAQKTHEC